MISSVFFRRLTLTLLSSLMVGGCSILKEGALLPYPRHPQASQAVERLLSNDPQLQSEARVELLALGSGAMPDMVESFAKASPETKLIMLEIITKVGEPTPLVVRSFAAAGREESPPLRQFVAYRSSLFPQLAPELAPILQPLVDDTIPSVRAAAITTLGSFPPPETISSERLARLMSEENLQVLSAATAIAVNRPEEPLQRMARASLSKLVGGLHDPSPAVRSSVIFAIGRFGPVAAPAIPPLTEVLSQDALPEIQFQAALALNKIGTREAVEAARPKLEQFAQSNDPTMATAARAILRGSLSLHPVREMVVQQPQPLAPSP